MYTWGRKQGCRLSLDYTYKGMRVGFLENDLIRVGILLDKGADIFEFTYKPRDLDFLCLDLSNSLPNFKIPTFCLEVMFFQSFINISTCFPLVRVVIPDFF